MGIVISHKLCQNKVYVKNTLDVAEKVAEGMKKQAEKLGISFEIRRPEPQTLLVDIGNCETLAFEFQTPDYWQEKKDKDGWNYEWAVLTNDGKEELEEGYKIEDFPQNELVYSAGFSKTQFANNIIEHKFVADIIRVVASFCRKAEIDDEGDYYHSGNLGDAVKSIGELGKMIDSIGGMLEKQGWKDTEIVKGGKTKIGKILK